jgi:dipeptidyl aminopeptidase/acylaminoacyl peptidase
MRRTGWRSPHLAPALGRRAFLRASSSVFIASAPLCAELAACAGETPILPRLVFFGDPACDNVQLSPDGRHIAYLAPLDGVPNLWLVPLTEAAVRRPLTRVAHRGVSRGFFWAFTNRHVVFFRDHDGDENWYASSVDIESGKTQVLTPDAGVKASHVQSDRCFPNDMLFQHNARDKQFFDLYRIDVISGESRLIYENREYSTLIADGSLTLRLAQRFAKDGTGEYFERRRDGDWVPFTTVPISDADATMVVGFSNDGNTLYMIDSRGRDRAVLRAIDMVTRQSVVLAADDDADIVDVDIDPATRRPTAALAISQRCRWHAIDQATEEDLRRLTRFDPGDLSVTGRSIDNSKMTVFFERDSSSGEYALLDRQNGAVRTLFKQRPILDAVELCPLTPITISARDGMILNGYITVPQRRRGRSPLVLAAHGGPYARDRWGFNPLHQWLANRGYAVISINYRGSTGFGKAFVAAADHEWGARMQDDLISAVQWAVDGGIADPSRIGFYGRSYGGYAALMAAVKSPDLFCCIVDLFGISNLLTFMAKIPPYEGPAFTVWKQRLGDPGTEEGRRLLEDRSPITHVDRAVRPILIAQGLRDVRVPPAESQQMVAALSQRGVPVTYLTFEDEGHGFVRSENRLALFAVVEAFLAHHLGGRYEPVGADFDGSTLKFETGRELISGLGTDRRAPRASVPLDQQAMTIGLSDAIRMSPDNGR